MLSERVVTRRKSSDQERAGANPSRSVTQLDARAFSAPGAPSDFGLCPEMLRRAPLAILGYVQQCCAERPGRP